MKSARIPSAALAALLAAGCAATPQTSAVVDDTRAAESKQEPKEVRLRRIEREMEVASARLAVARLEQEAFEQKHKAELQQARAEMELAQAKLALFREEEAPRRLASERLDLQQVKDRAQEAADELKQIEIMYEDQDLDDVTAEFVVSRGRRHAARAAARIEIEEGALRALEERELPREEQQLQLEVDKAAAHLRKLELQGTIDAENKSIAIWEAEDALAQLQEKAQSIREEDPS